MAYTRGKTDPQNDGMRYTSRRRAPEPHHTRVRGAALGLHIADVLQDPAAGSPDEQTPDRIQARRIREDPGDVLAKIVRAERSPAPRKPLEERDRVVGPLQVYPIGMENRSLGPLLLQPLTTEIKALLSHPTPPKKFAYATPQTSCNHPPKGNDPPTSTRQPPTRPAPA